LPQEIAAFREQADPADAAMALIISR